MIIEVSKKIAFSTNWNAKDIYSHLRSRGLLVNYNQDSFYNRPYLDFVVNGMVWNVIFNRNKSEEKAQVRLVSKRIPHDPFPGEWIRLYKRHWWY